MLASGIGSLIGNLCLTFMAREGLYRWLLTCLLVPLPRRTAPGCRGGVRRLAAGHNGCGGDVPPGHDLVRSQ